MKIRRYVQETFVAGGMVAVLCVQWALRDDRQPKPFALTPLTTRHATPAGFGLKVREWNDRRAARAWRSCWTAAANACLAEHGHAGRIDHRSYAERGIDLEPQNKIGPNAARRAQRGEPSERVDEHRAIAARNAQHLEQRSR